MKNKKLLCLMALFTLGTVTLAGCGKKNESPSEQPSPTSQPETQSQSTKEESNTPSNESVAPVSDSSEEVIENVEHIPPLVKSLVEGTRERTFDEAFDTMVEDFSGETMLGTTTGLKLENGVLRVVVDSQNGDFPTTDDVSIYKAARSGRFESYDGIGFRMRKIGDGNLDLSKLVLGLRGDDAYPVYNINLGEAVDPDGEPLHELGDEFVDVIVSPNLSIEDADTVYDGSTLRVLDQIVGIHLKAVAGLEIAQALEISEVFVTKGAERTTIDKFDREKVNKPDTLVDYWRDSIGYIATKGVALFDGTNYTTPVLETIDKQNVVLGLNGFSNEMKVATLDGNGNVLSEKSFADLKDDQGNNIKEAVTGAYGNFVINFEASGLVVENAKQIRVTSKAELNINKVFLTDMATEQAALDYPLIDVESANFFDNFNRTQSGFDGDYDKSSQDPVVTGAGLNYALSYHNGDKVKIENGVVTFDATEPVDYINFKEGKNNYNGESYLVLSVKGEGGATLNDFRFDVGNGVTYINQMVSAAGLPLPSLDDATYPYTTSDGFKWLIIDLAKSNMAPKANDGYIDFYYSGTGKLSIDAAFFANEKGEDYHETEITDEMLASNLENYCYVGAFNTDGGNLIKLKFTGDEGVTLESVRLQPDQGEAKWFKDGSIIDNKGNPIDANQNVDGLELIIDLKASGLDPTIVNHIHAGQFGDAKGKLGVTVYSLTVEKYEEEAITEYCEASDLANYSYLGAFNTNGGNLIKLVFTGDEGVTLESVRLQPDKGEAKWFKDGAIKDADGNVIDATQPAAGLEVVVDLKASGLDPTIVNHIHAGQFGDQKGLLGVTVYKLSPIGEAPYSERMLAENLEAADLTNYCYVGAFNTNGTNLVKLYFAGDEGVTLESVRLQPDQGEAKWFKDGAIKDADGNVIDAKQEVNGLGLVIDLKASGLDPTIVNHIHAGQFGDAKGKLAVQVVALDEVKKFETSPLTEKFEAANLENYSYLGAFNTDGGNYVMLSFEADEDVTLQSVRLQPDQGEAKWFKDGAIKDLDGNAIDGTQKANGLELVIDLKASGLDPTIWNHIHAGQFENSTGKLAVTVSKVTLITKYTRIVNSLEQ